MIDADTDTKAQGLMDLVVDQVEKIKKNCRLIFGCLIFIFNCNNSNDFNLF